MRPLREYTPEDSPATLALAEAVQANLGYMPLQYHREWRIAIDAPRNHGENARAYVVEDDADGRLIGYGSVWSLHSPLAVRLHVLVAPDAQNQGVGGAIYERLLDDARRAQAPSVQARIREACPHALRFAEKRGFSIAQKMVYLRAPVQEIDAASFALPLAKMEERGVTLTTFAEEQKRDADCWKRLCDLFNAINPDTPESQLSSAPPMPLERFVSMLQGYMDLPDGNFIAKIGDEWIGWTSLTLNDAEPNAVNVGHITGVRRERRRQGVALALKALSVLYAQREGYREIQSKSANPAMISLSEQLGFRRESGEFRLIKRLNNG